MVTLGLSGDELVLSLDLRRVAIENLKIKRRGHKFTIRLFFNRSSFLRRSFFRRRRRRRHRCRRPHPWRPRRPRPRRS